MEMFRDVQMPKGALGQIDILWWAQLPAVGQEKKEKEKKVKEKKKGKKEN